MLTKEIVYDARNQICIYKQQDTFSLIQTNSTGDYKHRSAHIRSSPRMCFAIEMQLSPCETNRK